MKHGYLQNPLNIKFSVLYILRQLRKPVSFSDPSEIVMCEDAVNYFEYAEAAMGLKETGHMSESFDENGVPLYEITSKGMNLVDVAEQNLPYTVKAEAQKAIFKVLARQKRDASISTETIKHGEDIYVRCSLKDPFCTIMSMDMMVVTPQQATFLEHQFKNYAELIYNKILSAMLMDYDSPEEDNSVENDN